MKIYKIEMENLNSLKGKWTIDFEDKSYKLYDNQFVICGDTGSGKTTILDAIMLGLYGKTPREEISKDDNEILRRGAGKCMAAVTYECNGLRYRSEFSQNRARDQVNGKLRPPKTSIQNIETGAFYDVKSIKGLVDTTTKIIGLNYDQFCKSVLLAQGSFSKFLKGNEREKAEILAKLNGTEDYKKAAAWLWEDAKNKILENNKEIDEINAIKILSEEEVTAYEKQIQHCKAELEKQKNEQEDIDRKLLWKQDVIDKENALENANKKKEDVEKNLIAFLAEKEALEKAEKAVNCEASYALYERLLNNKEAIGKTIENTEKLLLTAEKNKDEAETEQKEYKNRYEDLSKKQTEHAELWKKVRILDTEIEGLKKRHEEQQDNYAFAKKEYENSLKDYEELNTKLEADRAVIDKETSYIEAHKEDENLDSIISGLKEKNSSLKGQIEKYEELKSNKESKDSELLSVKKELESIQASIRKIEEELQEFISANYKSISNVLRRNFLKEGKACPVCGSNTHPICENSIKPENDSEHILDNNTAATAGELSGEIEQMQSELNAAEQTIAVLDAEIKSLQSALDAEKKEITESIQEINQTISAWELKVEGDIFSISITETIHGLLDKLQNRSTQYKEANRKKNEAVSRKVSDETALNAIKLEELKAKEAVEEKRALDFAEELDSKNQERKLCFGEKNVDEEEANYVSKINNLWKEYQKSIEKCNQFQIEFSSLDTQKKEYLKNRMVNEKDLENATEKLNKEMSANGFSSIDELKSARLEKEQVSALQKKREALKNAKIETDTMLKDAEKKYHEVIAKNLTKDSIEELESRKEVLKKVSAEISESIGEINKILTDNEKAVKEKADLAERKLELEKQNIVYKNLQNIIGPKSGDEIGVFVQTLALNNLLIKANEHLEVIMPEYKLIQKPGHVDCLVRDVNRPEPENDRPISNFSGGETFCFSLALALGIAEIASNKVQIESLFLDEGFGTLSGEPLERSIRALKRLGKTGKTLGIITHVDRVIESFPQKITAKKVNGVSTLQGAGISCL